MKKLSAVSLLAGLALVISVHNGSSAQDMRSDKQRGDEFSPGRWADPMKGAQHRLTELKQMLNLKPSQQTAWDTFSNAMMAQAKMQMQSKDRMESMRDHDDGNTPTPEKMERMADGMRMRADNLKKAAADVKAFYDALTIDQKTIFDLYAKGEWHRQMMERMHPMRHGQMG